MRRFNTLFHSALLRYFVVSAALIATVALYLVDAATGLSFF